MGYIYLILTIIFETTAITFMKLSDGFQQKSWVVFSAIMYILSFIFLTLSLKQIPAGIANAIWAGSSTILVALIGVLLFKEELNTLQLVFLSLIIIGLVGLNLAKSA